MSPYPPFPWGEGKEPFQQFNRIKVEGLVAAVKPIVHQRGGEMTGRHSAMGHIIMVKVIGFYPPLLLSLLIEGGAREGGEDGENGEIWVQPFHKPNFMQHGAGAVLPMTYDDKPLGDYVVLF